MQSHLKYLLATSRTFDLVRRGRIALFCIDGVPSDTPGFLVVGGLFGHLADFSRSEDIPSPSRDGIHGRIGEQDHFVVGQGAGHWRVIAGVAGIVEVNLVPFVIADIVVVETGASGISGGGFPMLNKEATVLFARDGIVADGFAVGSLHVPIADPEIELMVFGGAARKSIGEEFLEFGIASDSGEFRGVEKVWAAKRSVTGIDELLQRAESFGAILCGGVGAGEVKLVEVGAIFHLDGMREGVGGWTRFVLLKQRFAETLPCRAVLRLLDGDFGIGLCGLVPSG